MSKFPNSDGSENGTFLRLFSTLAQCVCRNFWWAQCTRYSVTASPWTWVSRLRR